MNEYSLIWRIEKSKHIYEKAMGHPATHIMIDHDTSIKLQPETFTILDELRAKHLKIAGLEVIRCSCPIGFMIGEFEEVK